MASYLRTTGSRLANSLSTKLRPFVAVQRVNASEMLEEGNRMLNRLTGYDQCELLRNSVNAADRRFQELRERLHDSRTAYTKAITERSLCQKELNGLLQRKPSWLDTDLHRFTELYRAEMRLEAGESAAREANEQLEKLVDQAHHGLVSAMRERYQEEQLWSDKIRRASTFGTFGLMLLNVLIFAGVQLYSEPRKLQRYMTQFEGLLSERLDEERRPPSPPPPPVKEPKSREILTGAAAIVLLNCLLLLNLK